MSFIASSGDTTQVIGKRKTIGILVNDREVLHTAVRYPKLVWETTDITIKSEERDCLFNEPRRN